MGAAVCWVASVCIAGVSAGAAIFAPGASALSNSTILTLLSTATLAGDVLQAQRNNCAGCQWTRSVHERECTSVKVTERAARSLSDICVANQQDMDV